MRSLLYYFKYENRKLILDIKKTKLILTNDIIKAIKLYFKNLSFKNIFDFYKIKNMRGLKQGLIFK